MYLLYHYHIKYEWGGGLICGATSFLIAYYKSISLYYMCVRAKHYLFHLNFLLVVYAMQVNFIPLFDLIACIMMMSKNQQ